ncbi:hypothetical protein PMAL9190_03807 [Photobacterium malacitanum]|uniref:Uncharacterized protein n=1 Tax=Photobacterium malacitanum TaxID=2204294 RepID=A0A1Y6MRF1_9GAMM|nr:hypothetical protein PMAL9190_03807 [Photobacterium malacitanum]
MTNIYNHITANKKAASMEAASNRQINAENYCSSVDS